MIATIAIQAYSLHEKNYNAYEEWGKIFHYKESENSERDIPHVHDVHLSKKYQMEPEKCHTVY